MKRVGGLVTLSFMILACLLLIDELQEDRLPASHLGAPVSTRRIPSEHAATIAHRTKASPARRFTFAPTSARRIPSTTLERNPAAPTKRAVPERAYPPPHAALAPTSVATLQSGGQIMVGLREAVLVVRVNGQEVSSGAILLEDADGTWYASAEDIRKWRIPVSGNPTVTYAGVKYTALRTTTGLRVNMNAATQSLDLDASPGFLVPSVVEAGARIPPTTQTAAAAFVNYAFHGVGGATAFVNGLLQGGWSGESGFSLTSSILGTDLTHGGRLVRLETTIKRDFQISRTSLALGDAVKSIGTNGIPVRFAGVSYGTNFATAPGFVSFPEPSVAGIAQDPSTLTIAVNGTRQDPLNIPPGPFLLTDVPVVAGSGHVQVAVTDALGRTRYINESYYAGAQLLKRGLSDFSYDAGFLRTDYALRSARYGPGFVSAADRYGFTDRFTGESFVQCGAGSAAIGIGGTVQPARAGEVGVGLAVSASRSGGGVFTAADYRYTSQRASASFRTMSASDAFRELGVDPLSLSPIHSTQASFGYSLERVGTVEIAYTNVVFRSAPSMRILSGTYARPAGVGQYLLTYSARAGANAASITAVFITSLGPRASAFTSHTATGSDHIDTLAIHQSPPLGVSGSGYALDIQHGVVDAQSAAVSEQTQRGTAGVSVLSAGGATAISGDLSGGYVAAGGVRTLSGAMGSSYGIAILPGYSGVRVLVNNQEIGRTDARGVVSLPNLLPYQRNVVSIDPDDLPASANVREFSKTVVPVAGHAAVVVFSASNVGGVLFRAIDGSGKPLAPGTELSIDGSVVGVVAEDGDAYLSGVKAGKATIVALPGGTPCRITLSIPANVADIPDLGNVVCHP